MDPYAILGIKHGADKEEIKKAYKQLSKKYHPDVNNSPDAEAKFKEINNAYELLTKFRPEPINPFSKGFNFSDFIFSQSNMSGTSSLKIDFAEDIGSEKMSKIINFINNLGCKITCHSYTSRVG